MATCIIIVDKEKCDGCGTCVDSCPAGVYEVKDGKSEPAHPEECLNCDSCATLCPNAAITIQKL